MLQEVPLLMTILKQLWKLGALEDSLTQLHQYRDKQAGQWCHLHLQ
jgi:hypothetical protein